MAQAATGELLTLEEVRPGVWSVPMPMPAPLRYVFVYAVELEDGLLLIDAGWDGPLGLAPLETQLATIGAGIDDVRGVMLTHGHRDHFGLAARIREESGAWVALHKLDAELLERRRTLCRQQNWFRCLGLPTDEARAFDDWLFSWVGAEARAIEPDRLVDGGAVIEAGPRRLHVLHTPGHSPGHLCFVDRAEGIIFTGDHVLSRTTPTVNVRSDTDGSPLDDYLSSLQKVLGFRTLLALPGHEERVLVALRAAELIAHHEAQLRGVKRIVAEGSNTVLGVASEMTWSRQWGSLEIGDRYLALGEALAHLRVLEGRGTLTRIAGSPARWQLIA